MPLNQDFEELLYLLNSAHAKYLVVGAYAVIAYTEPRYTKVIDIWIKPECKNAEKVYDALKRFGAPIKNLSVEDLTNPEMVYQIGMEPNRFDILMGIANVSFDKAWKNKRLSHYGKERTYLLHLEDLIRAKKAAGSLQDLIDLERLLQVPKRKKKNR